MRLARNCTSSAAALLRAAEGTRLYVPLLIAATTGVRRGELLALRWRDIDGEVMRVRQALKEAGGRVHFKPPKSAKSQRAIALPSVAVEALRRHRAEQAKERLLLGPDYQDNGLVFCHPDGRVWRPDTFTSAYRAFIEKAGMGHVRLHDFRHAHATHLLRQGVHPKVVSERFGHATIAITLDLYSHVLPDMQAEAASKIDGAMPAAIEDLA